MEHADGYGVQAAFKPAGGTWQPKQTVSVVPPGVSGYSVQHVRLAMTADGLAVATWARSVNFAPAVVEAAVKPAGATAFGPPVSVPGANGAAGPDVAVAPNGDAVVVWQRQAGGVGGAIRPAGGSFAALAVLSPVGGRPRVAMDAHGRATAVWEVGSGGVHAAERGSAGDFGPAKEVTNATSYGSGARPQVVVEPDGTAVVAWISDVVNDGVEKYVVRWAARPPGATFGPAGDVFAARQRPALAIAGDGTAMLLSVASPNVLQSSVRPPGGSFGPPQDVERSAKVLRDPVLAFDGSGDAVALWSRDEDGFTSDGYPYNRVRSARYDHQAPASANLIFNSGVESDLAEWNTSGSAAGVTLTREAGGQSGEWAARLANPGTSAAGCTLNDVPFVPLTTASGTYTATLWVRSETAGQTLRLRLREYRGGTLVGSQATPVTLTTSWQQVAVKYTTAAPGDSTLDFNAYVSGAAPGTCFLADGASLALEAEPSPPPPPPPPPPDPGLIGNGGFEADLAGWNASGSGAGVSLSRAAGGHSGAWAAKLTNTATTAGTCTLNDAPNAVATTAAGTYTASLWVRADSAGQTLKLRLREYSGATLAGTQTTQLTLSTAWQQAVVALTPGAAGASTLDFNAYVSGAAPGTCFVADDASIALEPAPAPPPPPPAENLIANAGFEADLAGWNVSGSGTGVALTRDAGGHSGGWAAKLANTGTTVASCTLNDSPNVITTTEAATYTASLWVRAPTAGQTLRLRLREYTSFYGSPNNSTGGVFVGSQSTAVTLTTSWQKVTVSYTPATPGTVLDLNAYISGAPPGSCFLADDAAIHKA